MSKSNISVAEYLKPTVEEVEEYISIAATDLRNLVTIRNSKSVNDRLLSQAAAEADNNKDSNVNITQIYNTILALANKQDDHHDHSIMTLVIVATIAIAIILVVVYVIIKRFFNKKVQQQANQVARAAAV